MILVNLLRVNERKLVFQSIEQHIKFVLHLIYLELLSHFR
jgi:hypothetical protein